MMEPRIVRRGSGDTIDGEPWLFKATAASSGGLFDLMVGVVAHGSGPPLHVHAAQADSFLVLDGRLAIQVGEHVHELGPGDFATVPPGVPHTFDSPDEAAPAIVVNLMVPGGLHDYLSARERLGVDATEEQHVRLAEKFGATVVGPPLRDRPGDAE